MNKFRILFYIVWLLLLSLAPITVFSVTPWSLVKDDQGAIVNLFQRMIGLWAYTLLFVQIIIGAFMDRWIEKYGPWVLKFHVFEGILIYTLIIIHPLLFTVFYYLVGRGFDPFYAYLDVCVLCDGLTEFYYNFGRVGFWFLTIGVFAGLFRALNHFMRTHWKKFHVLNYVAFVIIFVHSLMLGTDVGTAPFSLLHAPALAAVAGIICWKVYKLYKK